MGIAAGENGFACSGCRDNDLLRPILFFVAAKKNGSPAAAVATTRSVSDSNLRSCKEEWPACRGCRDNDLPRPILFFVAAKKNGPPAASVATTIFRVRFYSSIRQRKMVPPADRSNTELQRFLISGGQFGNRCRECPEIAPPLQRFLISGGQFGNRCKETL